jgi:hypothetical protein
MSALSPFPNAAFAIPDFDTSLRGGKLIHRGISHPPAVPPAGQSRGFDGITEFSELTELER